MQYENIAISLFLFFFSKNLKFFQANLSVILFTKMKDKETPFQAAFEKQNFDNFIARMGTFPAHGAAVQVRFARKAAVELIALTDCNTTVRNRDRGGFYGDDLRRVIMILAS